MSVISSTATSSHPLWVARVLGSGLLTAALLTGVAVTGANAAGPDGYSEPQVAAIASSGLVQISTEWSGYVQYKADSGSVRSDQVVASASCSGFVADGAGYLVTAGHCVDPQQGRLALIRELLATLVNGGTLTEAEAEAVAPQALQSWNVAGAADGSPIDRRVSVSQAAAAGSAPVALTASVVELRPADQGDIALLMVQAATPMPALRVASGEVEVGAQIAVLGYPTDAGGAIDPGLAPTFTAGRTSARQSSNGVPFLQIDAIVPGMSGGPVVDASGDVVGIVSSAPFPTTAGFTFASAAESVASLLSRNGVDRVLDLSDRSFRDGLTSYFAGDLDEAISEFDLVLAVIPDHQVALELRSKAAQSLAEHAGDRVGGNKAGGVAVATKSEQAPDVSTAASVQAAELPVFAWGGGILLALLMVGGAATGWLRRRSARSGGSARVRNAVRAASVRSTTEPVRTAGTPGSAVWAIAGSRNTDASQGANVFRNANVSRATVPPRFIPADMMCTTVPPDLMRTTVSADLLRTTVMR